MTGSEISMLLDVLVLAAGKGTRMCSALPKVLHPLAGKPLLAHVFKSVETLDNAALNVIVGHGKTQIQEAFNQRSLNWIEQRSQLGTAHAVLQAIPFLRDDAKVLIVYGDVPLIKSGTLEKMLSGVDENAMALLTVELEDPTGYGRILRNSMGEVIGIVEQKDAAPEQLKIREVNTGVMALPAQRSPTPQSPTSRIGPAPTQLPGFGVPRCTGKRRHIRDRAHGSALAEAVGAIERELVWVDNLPVANVGNHDVNATDHILEKNPKLASGR